MDGRTIGRTDGRMSLRYRLQGEAARDRQGKSGKVMQTNGNVITFISTVADTGREMRSLSFPTEGKKRTRCDARYAYRRDEGYVVKNSYKPIIARDRF